MEAQGLGNIEGLGSVFLTVKKCFTFSDGRYARTFALAAGNRLFIADGGNNRVLVYSNELYRAATRDRRSTSLW